MADFSALKSSIQNYIKQNGNNEITGAILQQILLSMVTALGDNAINDLVTALGDEISARQNADTTLQTNINNEATARSNADTQLDNRITSEAEARESADNTFRGLIDGITNDIKNGYVYAGIATPSTTPASGKVFYLSLTAGTYTNFGATVVPQGINILKYNGSAWSLDSFIGLDDAPTQGSNNLVKSGGVATSINKRIDDSWLYGGHIANNYTKDNCTFDGGVISSTDGSIIEGGSGVWKYSDYLPIEHSNGIFLLTHDMYGIGWGIAFYDKNRVYCGGHAYEDGDGIQHSITIPINAKFFRFSINKPDTIAAISVSFDVTFENSIYGGLAQINGNDDISVYGLGDSTNSDDAQRLGTAYDNIHFSATKVIAKRLNAANYVNYSVPGTGVAFAYLKSQEIPDTATIVVIVVGINDLNAGDTIGDIDTILAIENVDDIPEDTILGIYVKMVKKLRVRLSKNAQIVCVSPYFYESTTIRADLVTFREGIRKMCWSIGSRKGMRFIDGCDVGITPSNYVMLCRDATHPMMEGQTVIASHILEHITPPSIAAEQYDLTDGYVPIVVNPYIPLVP